MYITKSDYLLFKQCQKAFWLQKNNPEVINNEKNKARMDKGNEVTEVARKLFPSGILIPYSYDVLEMVEKTKKMIEKGQTIIYEAAFEFEGSVVICDILKFERGSWEIYEVKSSTGMKERYIDDLSFQLYVVDKNVTVSTVNIVHINSKYIRNGILKVSELFKVVDVTKIVAKNLIEIPSQITKMKDLLKRNCPEQDIGIFCNKYGKDDFECPAKEYCWSHIPKYSVFNISRIGKKAFTLYQEGMINLSDIPDDYKLSDTQKFQVKAYKENVSVIEKEEIRKAMKDYNFPLYFLDFETFQQSIPLFDNVSPYQQLPFQYSLHVLEKENGELVHKEFLAKEGIDDRRKLAECLVRDIPKGVCSVAYNMSFEKKVLRDLSSIFPDLSVHLMDIHDNMVDLMLPFQKKWYYTNNMKGSYSIKYVLPALLPNEESLDYTKLNIRNGSMAMETFERLHTYDPIEIELIRKDLLEYCKLDTLAMVKIWEKLIKI